jgi:hypothetical protein
MFTSPYTIGTKSKIHDNDNAMDDIALKTVQAHVKKRRGFFRSLSNIHYTCRIISLTGKPGAGHY